MARRGVWIGGTALALACGSAARGEEVVLGEGSVWRAFATARTPLVRPALGEPIREETLSAHSGSRDFWVVRTAAAPAGWQQADFDDSGWRRMTAFGNPNGIDRQFVERSLAAPSSTLVHSPALALQCLRGKFLVPDPAAARGLRLSVAYRGGIVAYLNGHEVARGHLPAGEVGPETPADEYPPEAYEHPVKPNTSEGAGPTQLDLRIRTLEAPIPSRLVRPGVNVLALEIHRAPFFGSGVRAASYNTKTAWSTGGLVRVRLTAQAGVRPNAARPAGIQVWNCSTTERLDARAYGDPTELLRPMEVVGVRNGVFCGQVVMSSAKDLRDVRAEITALRRPDGSARLPAGGVTVLYATRGEWLAGERRGAPVFWDTLTDAPPREVKAEATGAILPVWVAMRVPAEAEPGTYEGALTVSAEGLEPARVPVQLRVVNWTLPDPTDFATHLGVIQSPESVALWYKVPLWSEEHWALVEASFRLLGELGNKTVYLFLIARTNLGNSEGMVRWVKGEGNQAPVGENAGTSTQPAVADPRDGYTPDFAILDRYLDLAQQFLKPDVVCLYAFDHESGGGRQWRYRGVAPSWPGIPVTRLDRATGQVSQMFAPRLDEAGAEAFWRPVFVALRERLAARGLGQAVMVGIANDHSTPSKEILATFNDWLPGVPWVVQTHPGDLSQGSARGYFTQVYIRSYSTAQSWRPDSYQTKYLTHENVAWRRSARQDWFLRGFGAAGADLEATRTVAERAFLHNLNGWGRIGADFWPLAQPTRTAKDEIGPGGYAKNSTTIAARYPETDWYQLNLERGGPQALFAPGPAGALPTVRFQMVREGLQEAEARIFIERALLDPGRRARLGDDLAARCDRLLETRIWELKSGCDRCHLTAPLFATAAEVAARLDE